MATETTTLTLMLDHLYYLTSDPNNDTGYTLEQVEALIAQHGGSHTIEATITHPVPPPYTVEGDIIAHQERIANNQNMITQLTQQLAGLEEGSDEHTMMQEQINSIEQDIQYCQEHIASLESV